jgi:hypothetical protein
MADQGNFERYISTGRRCAGLPLSVNAEGPCPVIPMERESEANKPVLEEWLGYWVFVTYMSGPNLDQNEPTKLVRGQPEAITASFFLEDYGPLGIEVTRSAETPTIFMSWGAVMYIQGPPPEVRQQIDEEVSKRTEGGAGLN